MRATTHCPRAAGCRNPSTRSLRRAGSARQGAGSACGGGTGRSPCRWRRILPALLLLAVWPQSAAGRVACPARPGNDAAARSLAGRLWARAEKHFRAGRYLEAARAWICSDRLVSHPTALFNIAKAAERARRLGLAIKYYGLFLKQAPSASLRATVRDKLALLEELRSARQRLARRIRPPPPTRRPGRVRGAWISGWAAVGLAGASGVVAAVLGGLALRARKKVEDAADGADWYADLRDPYQDYDRFRQGAWVSLGAGAALAIIGGLLLELSRRARPREAPTVRTNLVPGGGALSLTGRF